MTPIANESEVLTQLRILRDQMLLLPNQVADQVSDRLRQRFLPIPSEPPVPVAVTPVAAAAPPESPLLEAPSAQIDLGSVQAELREILSQRDAAQKELDDCVGQLALKEQRLTELAAHVADSEKEALRASERKHELRSEIDQLETEAAAASAHIEDFKGQAQTLEANLAEARTLLRDAEPIRLLQQQTQEARAALEARRAEFDDYRLTGENAALLLERLWPAWLRTGGLAEWRLRLEAGAFNATSPASFGLLFAAVHSYNAALRDSDPKTLHDALRDVGRRLYSWLRDLSYSDADSAAAALQWAEAINEDCAGRGDIEVPIPGNAANNQWMIFQPRGGSSPDVATVRSWCVRDAQKRPVHRAEIGV